MKHIFVILLSFNTENDTHNCIESLKKMEFAESKLSIIVVDNGSKTSFTLTPAEKGDHVYLIRLEDNMGFTGGNNVGIHFAMQQGATHLLILNNDTLVDKNLLSQLLFGLDTHKNAGVIVPKIYFAKGHEYHKDKYTQGQLGKVIWYAGGFFDWNNIWSIHRGVDEDDDGQYDKDEIVDFATGCCMLIPREVVEKVGMFDDKYFLYLEDSDLCLRIKKIGFSIWYCPKAFLWHINAGSTGGSGSNLHDYFLTRNRLFFGMKYAPLRAKFALIRESIRLLISGRTWQKKGIQDFYMRKFGKGTFFD